MRSSVGLLTAASMVVGLLVAGCRLGPAGGDADETGEKEGGTSLTEKEGGTKYKEGGTLSPAEILGGGGSDDDGYSRALAAREFRFPTDHGPHPDFRSEWWYFVGNLEGVDGRPFGFQLTFFRFALTSSEPERSSRWASRQTWMAHFAVTDVEGRRFHAFERFSRGALGLAGASCNPAAEPCRVGVGSWSAKGTMPGDLFPVRLQASAVEGEGEPGTATEVALDLTLRPQKPPVLQGDRGLSAKGPEPGNASFYYSLTRLAASGALRIAGEHFPVTGTAWMDREWSTSALGPEEVGWDWFALQLSDGRELMLYRIRRRDGTAAPASEGTFVAADGSYRRVPFEEVELTVLESWESPRGGDLYPARWRLELPRENLDLTVTPRLRDQELDLAFRYWEGAVEVGGTSSGRPVEGSGYVELTGYEPPRTP